MTAHRFLVAASRRAMRPVLCQPLAALHVRQLRQNSSLVSVRSDDQLPSGLAVMELGNAPVNALSLDMLSAMCATIDTIEKDKSIKGVVVTSKMKGIFSAGIDINEMYQPSEERLRAFWTSIQEMWLRLFMMKKPTAAAIAGHSPAGGCLIAMACDERAMLRGKFTIGLNETKLGIVAPFWFMDTMERLVGSRQTDRLVQTGELVAPDQALAMGLVDELVDVAEGDDASQTVVAQAAARLEPYLNVNAGARMASKLQYRRPIAQRLLDRRDEDTQHFVSFVTDDRVQAALGAYLDALKNKK